MEAPGKLYLAAGSLAKVAIDIFGATQPLIELGGGDGELEPVDIALGVLQSMACGYAVLCNQWEPQELDELILPTRRTAEALIRHGHVDSWAAGLGHPLSLSEADTGERPPYKFSTAPPVPLGVERVVGNFTAIAKTYSILLDARDTPDELWKRKTPRLRPVACRLLSKATETALWLRGNLERERLPIGSALLHMGAGVFIIAWGDGPGDVRVVSTEYLRKLVKLDHGDEWLRSRGATLPALLD